MLLTTTAGSPRRAIVQRPTSALGLSRHFGGRPITSGLPLETDIAGRHVSKVPQTGFDSPIIAYIVVWGSLECCRIIS